MQSQCFSRTSPTVMNSLDLTRTVTTRGQAAGPFDAVGPSDRLPLRSPVQPVAKCTAVRGSPPTPGWWTPQNRPPSLPVSAMFATQCADVVQSWVKWAEFGKTWATLLCQALAWWLLETDACEHHARFASGACLRSVKINFGESAQSPARIYFRVSSRRLRRFPPQARSLSTLRNLHLS